MTAASRSIRPELPAATGFRAEIAERLEAERASAAYANYLEVREHIYTMMDDWPRLDPSGGPSAYWREEIEGFLYMFDASPLMIGKLREQCYHITSVKSYDYRAHHTHKQHDYVRKYAVLKAAADGAELFVPESPALGGFGFEVGDGLANMDTLKFYEVLIGLSKSGLLTKFRADDRRVILEIGSGWGGFAYQFKTICPKSTYVCVDLPPTMLFSAVYLKTLFPEAKTLIYGEPGFEAKALNLRAYDFVFLPHYYFPLMPKSKIDLGLNMVSFQEMTTEQVDGYAGTLKAFGCRRIYSLNKDRSKHNTELSTVSEVLGKYYDLHLIKVCDMQYTQLGGPSKPPGELGVLDYRHYFGNY